MTNKKKLKQSNQTYSIDRYINERDEFLYLFTNFIKLDLRQFWHETERLEDQQIGQYEFLKRKNFFFYHLILVSYLF